MAEAVTGSVAEAVAWPHLLLDLTPGQMLCSVPGRQRLAFVRLAVDWGISQDGRRKLQWACLRKGGERSFESKLHRGVVGRAPAFPLPVTGLVSPTEEPVPPSSTAQGKAQSCPNTIL